MNASEARKIAEQFTPDVKEVLEIIRNEAMNGGFSTTGASKFLYDKKVRTHLEAMGYKIKWHDSQRDGYWEISW
jgi:hypothetical protein